MDNPYLQLTLLVAGIAVAVVIFLAVIIGSPIQMRQAGVKSTKAWKLFEHVATDELKKMITEPDKYQPSQIDLAKIELLSRETMDAACLQVKLACLTRSSPEHIIITGKLYIKNVTLFDFVPQRVVNPMFGGNGPQWTEVEVRDVRCENCGQTVTVKHQPWHNPDLIITHDPINTEGLEHRLYVRRPVYASGQVTGWKDIPV